MSDAPSEEELRERVARLREILEKEGFVRDVERRLNVLRELYDFGLALQRAGQAAGLSRPAAQVGTGASLELPENTCEERRHEEC